MIKIGLIGVGRMGSYHLAVYERLMNEGFPVKVVAVCDVDKSRLDGSKVTVSNLSNGMKSTIATRAKTKIDAKELDSNNKIDALETALNVKFSI